MKWIAIAFALIAGAWYITLNGGQDAGALTDDKPSLSEGAIVAVTLPASFSE